MPMHSDIHPVLYCTSSATALLTSKSSSSSKRKPSSSCPCLICDKNIADASAKSKGQDSVFCEGPCQGWLHRTCAGLSKSMFKLISLPGHNSPFYCLYCSHDRYSDQISLLKSTIDDSSSKLAKLESQSDHIIMFLLPIVLHLLPTL